MARTATHRLLASAFALMLGVESYGAADAAGRRDDRSRPAASQVRIRREPVVEPRSICRERAWIENRHAVCPVGLVVVRTQYLFSGKIEEGFVVHVPPRGRRALGCSGWPGAMRRTEFSILRAWYGRCPRHVQDGEDPARPTR